MRQQTPFNVGLLAEAGASVVSREASLGSKKIEWVQDRMGILRQAARVLKKKESLKGRRVGLALHVEAKTAALVLALEEAGAEVAIASCNPLSTDDDVATALRDEYGIK